MILGCAQMLLAPLKCSLQLLWSLTYGNAGAYAGPRSIYALFVLLSFGSQMPTSHETSIFNHLWTKRHNLCRYARSSTLKVYGSCLMWSSVREPPLRNGSTQSPLR